MISDRPFLFHIYIPCGKTFYLVPRSSVKVWIKYQGHIFLKNGHYVRIKCFTNTAFVFNYFLLHREIKERPKSAGDKGRQKTTGSNKDVNKTRKSSGNC